MRNCFLLGLGFMLTQMHLSPLALAESSSDWDQASALAEPHPSDPLPPPSEDPIPVPGFFGSCLFVGQFASGCMEFYEGTWTDKSMQEYCQKNTKPENIAVISQDICPKADFNSLCTSKSEEGSIARVYVNSMPSFICKKYMSGELTKRPAAGW